MDALKTIKPENRDRCLFFGSVSVSVWGQLSDGWENC